MTNNNLGTLIVLMRKQMDEQYSYRFTRDIIISNVRDELTQSYMDEMQDIADDSNKELEDVLDIIMDGVTDFYDKHYE